MDSTPRIILPTEIVEKILLEVPAYDLIFNKPWVCKLWTYILLQPEFWLRKLQKINIKVDVNIRLVLSKFSNKIQTACLYYTCLCQEHLLLQTPLGDALHKFHNKFTSDSKYSWTITDDFEEMLFAAGVLVTRSPKWVELKFYKDKIIGLPLLLSLLAIRGSTVEVYDEYGFWNFSPRYEYCKMLEGPSNEANIYSILGCVTHLGAKDQAWAVHPKQLCKTEQNSLKLSNVPWEIGMRNIVEDLRLSFAVDKNNCAIIPDIPDNSIMVMHVKAGSDVSKLRNIKLHTYSLIISGLESSHITWMTDAIEAINLSPESLILLNYQLDKISSIKLIQRMFNRNINPACVMCSSSTINADDASVLNDFATELWPEVDYYSNNPRRFTWFDGDAQLKTVMGEQ